MLLDNTEMTATWTELTKDLIDLGYQVWKVVAPVVASDSPEGHLPMDNVRFTFFILLISLRLYFIWHSANNRRKINFEV